jgi:hypothetical protein
MTVFCTPHWQAILKENQLDSFDALWGLTTPWFEEPNIRRGGWSGVTTVPVQVDNQQRTLFVKRQENHITRTWRHPIKGISTFEKEFHNLQRFHRYGIPTLNLAYFASRQQNKNRQAILVTEELAGYQSMDIIEHDNGLPKHQRRKLLSAVALVARAMHHKHLQHNCFYPKHIFVRQEADNWSVKIIDLEKTKRTLTQRVATIRDLATLSRHSPNISVREQLYFLKIYLNEKKLSRTSKQLIKLIQSKINAKQIRQ